MFFKGHPSSYVEISNRKQLDTKRSITIIAWVNPMGRAGPIFNFKTNGWGVHFWQTGYRQFFARFVKRNNGFTPSVASNSLDLRRWNYLACTYDRSSGKAALWKNGKRVGSRYIGKIFLSTSDNVRVGARRGDGRFFKGKIACLQVYNYALTGKQQLAVKNVCFKKSKYFLQRL